MLTAGWDNLSLGGRAFVATVAPDVIARDCVEVGHSDPPEGGARRVSLSIIQAREREPGDKVSS